MSFPPSLLLSCTAFGFPGTQIGDFGELLLQYGTGHGMGYYRVTHITAEQPDPMEGIGTQLGAERSCPPVIRPERSRRELLGQSTKSVGHSILRDR